MILLVVKALILTMLIGVVGIFSKNRMNVWWYAVIFVLMLITQWAFSRPLNAEDFSRYNYECNYEMTSEAQHEIQLMIKLMEFRHCGKALKEQEKDFYQDKLKFHKENALRTYNDAKERCWWLPRLNDRQNPRYCFTALIAGIAIASSEQASSDNNSHVS